MTLCNISQSYTANFVEIVLKRRISFYNDPMKRNTVSGSYKIVFAILLLTLILGVSPDNSSGWFSARAASPGLVADASSLINAVNALRAANGLPAYTINPILMAVAQQHAQYMAVAGVSHYGADGSSPWQRGLAAGYPLAGDLSRGGLYSENITAGGNMSVQDAVTSWQADAPHLLTMLSPSLTEIGAGVVMVGTYVYYDIDCARPTTSRQSQSYTPGPGGIAAAGATAAAAPLIFNTLIPETPLANGKVYHIVKPGETLWLIAVSYGVKIIELRRWNNLAENQNIYPGNKLYVKQIDTATPLPPTFTLTPTSTHVSTVTATVTFAPTPTATSIPVTSPFSKDSTSILIVIVVAALVLGAVFVWMGRKS